MVMIAETEYEDTVLECSSFGSFGGFLMQHLQLSVILCNQQHPHYDMTECRDCVKDLISSDEQI